MVELFGAPVAVISIPYNSDALNAEVPCGPRQTHDVLRMRFPSTEFGRKTGFIWVFLEIDAFVRVRVEGCIGFFLGCGYSRVDAPV